MKVTTKFNISKWDEKPYQKISEEMKLTKASVSFAFEGQIEGQAAVEWLMFYKHANDANPLKSSAIYVGLIRIEGKLNGKSGSFTLEDKGTFEAGVANSNFTIISGSGTGELSGISGTGQLIATHENRSLEIEYSFK